MFSSGAKLDQQVALQFRFGEIFENFRDFPNFLETLKSKEFSVSVVAIVSAVIEITTMALSTLQSLCQQHIIS
ncbi:hypothetical protein CEXT_154451 [Caerostris extrusa]|uniref:Uncharacterized protein n=1 Tax=Caerostris extrusa TaxID=172846 RepID=A0AAV4Y4W0_CAEEX|nr:hypothetical protein CEXT_154451 [Caerostris extrusa]